MKLLKRAAYVRYVIAKLSKFVQISMQTSSDSFLQRILWEFKRTWNQFPGHIFHWIFDKRFSFVILHKLAKFHYQTVYFPNYSIKCVSCFMLRYLRRNDIWISEKLNFDYLKNKKSFLIEIKNIFLVPKVLSFKHTKQTA